MRFVTFIIGLAGLSVLLTSPVRGAEVQNFMLSVQGHFTGLNYASLNSMNSATGSFQSHRDMTFTDGTAASLSGHRLEDVFVQTLGQVHIAYDADANPQTGNVVLSGCSGLFALLCSGTTQVFDMAAQSLASYTTNSMHTMVTQEGLLHRNDHDVRWTAGSTFFFNSGAMETVEFAFTEFEIELAPVPVPAALALLLGGLGGLAAIGRRQARARGLWR